MSIRSTNVYEERSLGIFEEPPIDENEEPNDLNSLPSRKERIGRYLGWHLRRQMSIGAYIHLPYVRPCVSLSLRLVLTPNSGMVDIWWLVWAVFVVAIIERENLLDESKKWFDLFRVLFEIVSAFGGIGLSLGLPSVRIQTLSGFVLPTVLICVLLFCKGQLFVLRCNASAFEARDYCYHVSVKFGGLG